MSGNNLEINLTANASGATAITKGMADMERGAKGATDQTLKAADAAKKANDAFEFMVNKRIARLKDLELSEKAAAEAARRTARATPERSGIYAPDALLRSEKDDAVRRVAAGMESARLAAAQAEEERKIDEFKQRGIAHQERSNGLIEHGLSRLKQTAATWFSISRGVMAIVHGIDTAQKTLRSLRDQKSEFDRSGEQAGSAIAKSIRTTNADDVEAVSQQILGTWGQDKEGAEFAKAFASMRPEATGRDWARAIAAARPNRALAGAGQTTAVLSSLLPGLGPDSLAGLVRRWSDTTGGKVPDRQRRDDMRRMIESGMPIADVLDLAATDLSLEDSSDTEGSWKAIIETMRDPKTEGTPWEQQRSQRRLDDLRRSIREQGSAAAFADNPTALKLLRHRRRGRLFDPDRMAAPTDRERAADLKRRSELEREADKAANWDYGEAETDILKSEARKRMTDDAMAGSRSAQAAVIADAALSSVPVVGSAAADMATLKARSIRYRQSVERGVTSDQDNAAVPVLLRISSDIRRIADGQGTPIDKR